MPKFGGMDFQKILIIQTAFIGDAILMTPLVENLADLYPQAAIDVLVNQDTYPLFRHHPKIRRVWTWDKKNRKYKKLFSLIKQIREVRYELVVNCHRFGSSGMVTWLSGAKIKVGFDKNPFSFAYTYKVKHVIGDGRHEVDRNAKLLEVIMDRPAELPGFRRPVLYPSPEDYRQVQDYQHEPYICMAPASIWFTKQFPQEKWITLIQQLPFDGNIYLLGASGDHPLCEQIRQQTGKHVTNLAGKLSLLQSAALMEKADLNYVNDSAPLHLASSVNAPVCVVYCSTVPEFGFYPLSDFSKVVELQESLACRPCGLHGYKACPEGHFKCARDIGIRQLLEVLQQARQQKAG